MHLDTNGLEVLGRAACLELLASAPVGRVGASIDALPVVLPVNYVVADERIVFRTGAGAKLAAASDGAVIAFEVDAYDPATATGWSVVVQSVAHIVPAGAIADTDLAELKVWGATDADHLVSLDTNRITGRRITGRA